MTCSKSISNKMLQVIMPPPRRGGGAGALSGDRRPSSVRLSVCLSDVAYIGSNSKTKRPRKKLCTGVPQVTCDSHTDFKVKRSKVKVTGGGILWRPPSRHSLFLLLCLLIYFTGHVVVMLLAALIICVF